MKTKILITTLIILAGVVSFATLKADSENITKEKVPAQTDLQRRQQIWINALEWCESRGREEAINPKDRDNTPSYGAFQFKPSTYAYFSKAYGLASTTDFMNAKQQKQIVEKMIEDKSVVWTQQFPDCVKNKVGLPPRK